jgi:hypothetical protein
MEQSVNTFTKLSTDRLPVATEPTVLVDAINAAFTTEDSNQLSLQNLLGNSAVATLKPGFRPLAIKVLRNIAYIVSIGTENGAVVGEIGTFPSPDWGQIHTNTGDFPLLPIYQPLKNFLKGAVSAAALQDDALHTQEFTTSNFNFTGELIELELQLSYDGSVNLILADGLNPLRMINSRFIVSTDGLSARLAQRNQGKDTNTYSDALFSTTKLIKQANLIPFLHPPVFKTTGYFSGGGARFYFKYIDSDGNLTDIIEESRLVVFAHEDRGANPEENTNQAVEFELENLDPQFSSIKVYYSFSSSAIGPTSEIREIINIYDYNPLATSVKITIFGDEDYINIDRSVLNIDFSNLGAPRTITQFDSKLLVANTKSTGAELYDKLRAATALVPIKEGRSSFNLNSKAAAGYRDPNLIYTSTGYWDKETYELGVVYILSNGRGTTPVFPLRGIDNSGSTANLADPYTTNPAGEDGFITQPAAPQTGENVLGIYRTSENRDLYNIPSIPTAELPMPIQTSEYKYLTIDAGLLNAYIQAAVPGETIGFFVTRKERRRDAICQGIFTNAAAFPIKKIPASPLLPQWEFHSTVGVTSSIAGRDDDEERYSVDTNSGLRDNLIDLSHGVGSKLHTKIPCKYVPAPGRLIEAAVTSADATFIDLWKVMWKKVGNTLDVQKRLWSHVVGQDGTKRVFIDATNVGLREKDTESNISLLPLKFRTYSAAGSVHPPIKEGSGKAYTAFYTGDELAAPTIFNTSFQKREVGVVYRKAPLRGVVSRPPTPITLNIPLIGPVVQKTGEDLFLTDLTWSSYNAEVKESLPATKAPELSYISESQDSYAENSFSARLANNAFLVTKQHSTWSKGYALLREAKVAKGNQEITAAPDGDPNEMYTTDSTQVINVPSIYDDDEAIGEIPMLDPDGSWTQYGDQGKPDVMPGSQLSRASSLGEDNLHYGSYLGAYFPLGVDTGDKVFITALQNANTQNTAVVGAPDALCGPFRALESLVPTNAVTFAERQIEEAKQALATFRSFVEAEVNIGVLANIYPNKQGALSFTNWKARYANSAFSETYTAISARTPWSKATGELKLFDGDCYVSIAYKRVYSSSGIEGALTATDTKAYRSGNNSGGLYNRGFFMPLIHLSNYNLALRTFDFSNETENILFNGPRELFTGEVRAEFIEQRSSKRPEAKTYNFGYNFTSDRLYPGLNERAPAYITSFPNRVFVSESNVQGSFANGYRNFRGLNFKDYHPHLGRIMKIQEQNNTVFVVFENGVGFLPINEKTMLSGDSGDVFIKNAEVLGPFMSIASSEMGVQHPQTVVAGSNYIYGYHFPTNKIWKSFPATSKKGSIFEPISDFVVQTVLTLLKDQTILNTGLSGAPFVKGNVDTTQDNIYFTFLNQASTATLTNIPTLFTPAYINYNQEILNLTTLNIASAPTGETYKLHPETIASLYYNETLGVWVSKLSWSPLFLFNLNGRLYSNSAEVETNTLWEHNKTVPTCLFYGQQHAFVFEFILVSNASIQKIVENLMIISNRSFPDAIKYTIDTDFDLELNQAATLNSSHKEFLKQRHEYVPALTSLSNIVSTATATYFYGGYGYEYAKHLEGGYITVAGGPLNGSVYLLGPVVRINNLVYNTIINPNTGNPLVLGGLNIIFAPEVEFGIIKQNTEYLEDHLYIMADRENGSHIRDKAIKIKVSYKGADYTTIHAILTLFNYSFS